MKKLLIKCNLAPGDMLTMTAAVKNLCTQYPEYKVNVVNDTGLQAYPMIWDGNPFIDPSINKRNADAVVEPEYRSFIHEADKNKSGHFIEAYTKSLSALLGISINAATMVPDVYLTEDEKAMRPMRDPYWLIFPGYKNDITTKRWPAKHWEFIVNRSNDITFVQLGSTYAHHVNPKIKGAVDMVGKTTLRELLVWVYHADGVVCGVTAAMHAAAAFDRKCVVIAGGREGSWWEKYPNHTYINTIGNLPCCEDGPCWKSHVDTSYVRAGEEDKVCENVVDGDSGKKYAKCMKTIAPSIVTKIIKQQTTEPEPAPRHVEMPNLDAVTICVCLYGDKGEVLTNGKHTKRTKLTYHELHVRCLTAIKHTTPPEAHNLIIGCNAVSQDTLNWIKKNLPSAVVINEPSNIHKYPLMRKMFDKVKTEWVVWFDDDSYPVKREWLSRVSYLLSRLPEAKAGGHMYKWELLDGQLEWAMNAEWFRGKEFTTSEKGTYEILFPTGGFVLYNMDTVRQLNWPDPRLDHNPMVQLDPTSVGVVISDAERRGVSQRSAGSEAQTPVTQAEAKRRGYVFFGVDMAIDLFKDGTLPKMFPEISKAANDINDLLDSRRVTVRKLEEKRGCASCGKRAYHMSLARILRSLKKFLIAPVTREHEKVGKELFYKIKNEYNKDIKTLFLQGVGVIYTETDDG